MNEKEAIDILHNGEKMNLTTLLRTFKREGIENFIVTKKEVIEPILNLIEKQQAEIEKYKMLLAETNVQFLNSNLKTKRKNEEDLEMLYAGCQAQIEKKDKIIDLMAEQLVKAHEWFYSKFDNYTKEDFVKYFNQKIEKGE